MFLFYAYTQRKFKKNFHTSKTLKVPYFTADRDNIVTFRDAVLLR